MKDIPSFWVDSAARIDVDANKVGRGVCSRGCAAGWREGGGGGQGVCSSMARGWELAVNGRELAVTARQGGSLRL